ncbi:hypothetical protein AB1Y20_023631 [Prymnesium parvum]|uniref:O-GlcNAc transferase C-terminal domain-containing protein n=1 Tax=Prymnesium parvum TaxID=97485 RepID=A0AB34JEE8_PRYPA
MARWATAALAATLVGLASPQNVPREHERMAHASYQRGRELFEADRLEEAFPFFKKASEWAPHFPEPFVAMSQALSRLGRPDEARRMMGEADKRLRSPPLSSHSLTSAARAAVHAVRSSSAPPHTKAVVARTLASFVESGALIDELERSAERQDAHNARVHRQQLVEAERLLRQLLASPLEMRYWWQLGLNAFNERREFTTAALALEVIVRFAPARMVNVSYYLLYHSWQQLCDWRQYDSRLRTLRMRLEEAAAGKGEHSRDGVEAPYILLVSRLMDTDPWLVMQACIARSQSFGRMAAHAAKLAATPSQQGEAPPPPPHSVRFGAPSRHLREGQLLVGYLSNLPAGHVTYDLVGSMLRFHSDRWLRPVWYTGSFDAAQVRAGSMDGGGLKHGASNVRLILHDESADAVAQQLRADKVGVLIDLDGWVGDAPPRQLMARRPSPVQSHWLGWAGTLLRPSAGTTGDAAMHYIVSDRTVSPPHHRGRYSEAMVVMPLCYQLNDHRQLYPPRPTLVLRRKRHFTLSNFNQLMKVGPDIFDVWAGAMLGAPFAIIFLLTGVTSARLGYPSAARNLGRELGFRGVHQIRLLRAGALRKPEHLLRVAECDLALDTLSYNSHTTGSDALWAGVPLVTLSGGNFPSRVAQSLTVNTGQPETVAFSFRGYEDAVTYSMKSSLSTSSRAFTPARSAAASITPRFTSRKQARSQEVAEESASFGSFRISFHANGSLRR